MKLAWMRTCFFCVVMTIGTMVVAQKTELRLHWPSLDISTRPYLTQFYGNKLIFVDSLSSGSKAGHYYYDRTGRLESGIYFIQVEGQSPIELILDQDQQFTVSMVSGQGLPRFEGSDDNERYQGLLGQLGLANDSLKSRLLQSFCQMYPTHLVCRMRRMQQEVALPDRMPTVLEGISDQPWELAYLKRHYWDSIDFRDPLLLRTPLWGERLKRYVEGLLVPAPSLAILKADVQRFLDTLEVYPDLFRYSFGEMLSYFETAPFLESESIWVFMVEQYIQKGHCPWISSAVRANLTQRIADARPWMLGEQPPEIWYPDTSNTRNFQDMHSIFGAPDLYTLVIFWDPDCSHCKQELAALRALYPEHLKLGFDVVAVAMHKDLDRIKRVVQESQFPWISLFGGGGPAARKRGDLWPIQSMPTLFLLDAEKRIVLKNVTLESIEMYLKNIAKH